jgi:hypothetical protein
MKKQRNTCNFTRRTTDKDKVAPEQMWSAHNSRRWFLIRSPAWLPCLYCKIKAYGFLFYSGVHYFDINSSSCIGLILHSRIAKDYSHHRSSGRAISNKQQMRQSCLPQLSRLSFYASKWIHRMDYKDFQKNAALHGGNIDRVRISRRAHIHRPYFNHQQCRLFNCEYYIQRKHNFWQIVVFLFASIFLS